MIAIRSDFYRISGDKLEENLTIKATFFQITTIASMINIKHRLQKAIF